jgi:glucosamine-6-phosphate deaminase
MEIEVLKDEEALAARAADAICDAVRDAPQAILGLPTGNTPIHAYFELARRCDAGQADLGAASVYALDEFLGVPRDGPGSNGAFFKQYLRVPFRAVHVPNPDAPDAAAHIVSFAEALRRAGSYDLCVLGIGRNGHIAFNEPGSQRDTRARVVELDATTRESHAAMFGSLETVPSHGMTLGVADILEARRLLVLAQGEHKAEIVRAAIEGPPSAAVPASWLQEHGAVTWLLDETAAAHLSRR